MSFLNMEKYNGAILVGVYETEEEYLQLLNDLQSTYANITADKSIDETKISFVTASWEDLDTSIQRKFDQQQVPFVFI
jgi:hypothetical protein